MGIRRVRWVHMGQHGGIARVNIKKKGKMEKRTTSFVKKFKYLEM